MKGKKERKKERKKIEQYGHFSFGLSMELVRRTRRHTYTHVGSVKLHMESK